MNDCMTQEDAMNMNNEQAIQILKPMQKMMIDQHGCPVSDAYFALGKAIESLKTNAVEVVRCADCKWFQPINNGDRGYCGTPFHGAEVYEDDYCSDGERAKE